MAKMDVNNTWKGYENGVQDKTSSSSDSQICPSTPTGPDPAKLKAILERTSNFCSVNLISHYFLFSPFKITHIK